MLVDRGIDRWHHAVNPADKKRGHATAYLWHDVLGRETFLDILGKFVSVEVKESTNLKTQKKTLTPTLLLPRYHQLGAVDALLAATLKEGVGHRPRTGQEMGVIVRGV